MNYHSITKYDMLNGEGLRTVLWVSGCEHHCKGCQNPQTWDKNSGIEFDFKALVELMESLKNDDINGVTFSGGDPLATFNRNFITVIARLIKTFYPSKTIWVYSGYKYEDIAHLEVMKFVDILVDGEFNQENREHNPNVKWRGDDSQRIIDVVKTRETGQIVERKDLY